MKLMNLSFKHIYDSFILICKNVLRLKKESKYFIINITGVAQTSIFLLSRFFIRGRAFWAEYRIDWWRMNDRWLNAEKK